MEEIIKNIYETSSYKKDYQNKTEFNEVSVGKATYGEITQKGVDELVKKFKTYFTPDTVFYDLGSGLGKMVAHIGVKYNVKKSVGIEYSKERHKGALFIQDNYTKQYKNIEFICGNFISIGFSDSTVIYMDNTSYPDNLMDEIYNNIPKGCLVIYKKRFKKTIEEEQEYQKNGIERTYSQNSIYWFVKK